MEAPGSRKEQAERSREALLDAAAEEFWRHGLDGTRIQDVLDRAGMTKGGLYHHFASKADIAVELAALDEAHWSAVAAEVGPRRGLDALGAYVQAVVDAVTGSVRVRAVLRMVEELPAGTADPFAAWRDFVLGALHQAVDAKEVPAGLDLRATATTIVDCLYGTGMSPASPTRRTDSAARARALWALLAGGLAAPRT